jgi:hypothetical protein
MWNTVNRKAHIKTQNKPQTASLKKASAIVRREEGGVCCEEPRASNIPFLYLTNSGLKKKKSQV